MSALVESFLANGGKAHFMESLKPDALKEANLLLIGGFIRDFASVLSQKGIDLNALESKNDSKDSVDSVQAFLLHPLHFNPYPNLSHFLYEVGCEEAVVALLASIFYPICEENLELKTFVRSLDIGNLASECNLSEEELEKIAQSFAERKSVIIFGNDLNAHKRVGNIGKILALLSQAARQIEIVFLDSAPRNNIKSQAKPIESLEELESYDGLVAYLQLKSVAEPILEVSKQFCQVGKIQEDTMVKIQLESQKEMKAKLYNKSDLKGMVGILWIPQTFALSENWDLKGEFCYQKVKISKVA